MMRRPVWPPRCGRTGYLMSRGGSLKRSRPESQRRRWPRLPIAIPVFVRSRDEKGKEVLEFATALNISAGGGRVGGRRPLSLSPHGFFVVSHAPVPAHS